VVVGAGSSHAPVPTAEPGNVRQLRRTVGSKAPPCSFPSAFRSDRLSARSRPSTKGPLRPGVMSFRQSSRLEVATDFLPGPPAGPKAGGGWPAAAKPPPLDHAREICTADQELQPERVLGAATGSPRPQARAGARRASHRPGEAGGRWSRPGRRQLEDTCHTRGMDSNCVLAVVSRP
jgi:hypothetical protein